MGGGGCMAPPRPGNFFHCINGFHVGLLAILQVGLEYISYKIRAKLIKGIISTCYVQYYRIESKIEFVLRYLSNQSEYF